MAAQTDIERIVVEIVADASSLVNDLAALQKGGMSAQDVFNTMASSITQWSQATGLSVKTVRDMFADLADKVHLFGVEGEQGALGTAAGMREVDTALKGAGQSAEETGHKFNILNTILGTMTAMIFFQLSNAIITTFTNAMFNNC